MHHQSCACDVPRTAGEPAGEDAYMALVLMTVWAIHTGRPLPAVPVNELSAEELEEFWADHLISDESAFPSAPGK